MSDAVACGRRSRLLNGIDDHSREWLARIVDTALSGRRVVGALTAIAERRRPLCMVVSDDAVLSDVEGSAELTSHAVSPGARTPGSRGITSRREAAAERLRGVVQWSFARRVLYEHLFSLLAAARRIIEA